MSQRPQIPHTNKENILTGKQRVIEAVYKLVLWSGHNIEALNE